MPNPGDMYLGLSGAEILLDPFGRRFTVRTREQAREERTVNGRLIKDIIYRKQEFRLSYDLITGDALDTYEFLFGLQQELSFRWYGSDGAENAYTVHMGPFSKRRVVLISDGLWSGTTIELAEV